MTLQDDLAKATEGSPELDLEIEKLLERCDPGAWCEDEGGENVAVWNEPRDFGSTVAYERLANYLPPYTTSIDAALTLVPESLRVRLEMYSGLSYCVLWGDDGQMQRRNVGKNPAIAIVLAALKAREMDK